MLCKSPTCQANKVNTSFICNCIGYYNKIPELILYNLISSNYLQIYELLRYSIMQTIIQMCVPMPTLLLIINTLHVVCAVGTQTRSREFVVPSARSHSRALFGRVNPTHPHDVCGARLELLPLHMHTCVSLTLISSQKFSFLFGFLFGITIRYNAIELYLSIYSSFRFYSFADPELLLAHVHWSSQYSNGYKAYILEYQKS